jgi:CPA1 family monovalent cation:H+ antiporter
MLLLALLLNPIAERLNIPFAGLLIVTGYVGSEILVTNGIDTGLRYDSFHDLIMYVFLPLLIFEAAYKIDAAQLVKQLFVILFFAIPIMLLSTVTAAVIIYVGIGYPDAFPWIAALLTGALLASTDPITVISLMRKAGVSERLCMLLDGEALFNDATAIVTFGLILSIALNPVEDIAAVEVIYRFLIVFFGGAIVGLFVGLGFLLLSRWVKDFIQQAIVTLIAAYFTYLLAEYWLHVSGVMAVLICGLVLGRVIHHDFDGHEKRDFVDDFWTFNVFVAESLMFLLVGVTITAAMFIENWLAILIAICAVLVARAISVFAGAKFISYVPRVEAIPLFDQKLMFLGGLRGAVTLALALALPTELDYWWLVQSIAFGVVVFALFVQAPLMSLLLKRQQ